MPGHLASQGNLVMDVGLQRVASGQHVGAAASASGGRLTFTLLLAGREDRQRDKSKEKLDAPGPFPSVFHSPTTKTFLET